MPEAKELTWEQREQLIEAGLDPVYSEYKNDTRKDLLLFERKSAFWVAKNIYGIDEPAKSGDNKIMSLYRKTMNLTIKGEEEEVKN